MQIKHLCITYTRIRNPYVSIVDAWLDSDMYGYRCCYKSRGGAINYCSDCWKELSREYNCPVCCGTGDAEEPSETGKCGWCNGTGKVYE